MPSRIVVVLARDDARPLVRAGADAVAMWIALTAPCALERPRARSASKSPSRDARPQLLGSPSARPPCSRGRAVEAGGRLADDERVAGVAPVAVARAGARSHRIGSPLPDHAAGRPAADGRAVFVDARGEVAGDRDALALLGLDREPDVGPDLELGAARARAGSAAGLADVGEVGAPAQALDLARRSSSCAGASSSASISTSRRARAPRAARRPATGGSPPGRRPCRRRRVADSASSTAPRKRASTSVRSCRSMPAIDRTRDRRRGSRGRLVEVVDDDAERPVAAARTRERAAGERRRSRSR